MEEVPFEDDQRRVRYHAPSNERIGPLKGIVIGVPSAASPVLAEALPENNVLEPA